MNQRNKSHKIGLVLGGVGAKGAFQAGVLHALKEANILEKVSYVSANSIGSINALMVVNDTIDECEKIWRTIGRKDALKFRQKGEKGIFSRQGLIRILKDSVDFEKISKANRQLYITAFNNDLEKIEYFLANNKTPDEILSYVLASSAIPYVYGAVQIGDYKYSDGFRDNVPIRALKNAGCDIIIVVGLRPEYHPSPEELADISVIDFTPCFQLGYGKFDSLDFKPENIEFRINNGYAFAKQVLENIKNDKNNPLNNIEEGFFKRLFKRLFKQTTSYNEFPNYYYRLGTFNQIGYLTNDKSAKDEIMDIIKENQE